MQSPIKLYKHQHFYKEPVPAGVYKVRFEHLEYFDNNPALLWLCFRIIDGEFEGTIVSADYQGDVSLGVEKPLNDNEEYLLACELANKLLTKREFMDLDFNCLVGQHCYVEVDEQERAQVIFSFRQQGGAK